MKLSIVIPNKNRKSQLIKCMKSISEQIGVSKNEYELIVVDGGSDDGSNQIYKQYESSELVFKVIYDDNSVFNISRIRNIGAKEARGQFIAFIDVDMLIPEDFTAITISKYSDADYDVICHYILGFGISTNDYEAKIYNMLTAENLREMIQDDIRFSDFRVNVFESVDNEISLLTAPWVYGWSAAITIRKQVLSEVSGFDETLKGWGSEDTELAYRLYGVGAKFVAEPQAFAVHMPHKTVDDKNRNNFKNRLEMHQHHKTIETELYAFLSGVNYNNILNIVNKIDLSSINPIYPVEKLAELNKKIFGKRVLTVGLDSARELSVLNITDSLVLNDRTGEMIQRLKPEVRVWKYVGLCTLFEDTTFDIAIVFEAFTHLMPGQLMEQLIRELNRISKEVVIMETTGFNPIIYNII